MRLVYILLFYFFVGSILGQTKSLQFTVLDQATKLPISGVHVFITDATFGTVSNQDGYCEFDILTDVTKELIFFHTSYDILTLQHSQYRILSPNDTIYLSPNGVDLDELLINGKNTKMWKKNYRKFSKAFIGTGKRAILCEIKNPQVLRFSNEDGVLKATAIDLLKIKNHYLGYDVNLLLKDLTIDKEGFMTYSGYAKFTDRSLTSNKVEIARNRKEAYEKSMNHFLLNLISDNLEEAQYRIKLIQDIGNSLKDSQAPKARDLVFLDSISGLHHIKFDNYLEVTHLNINGLKEMSIGKSSGGIESRVLGSSSQEEEGVRQYPVSYVSKEGPSLIVDKYGLVLNQNEVREDGYWAGRKISELLPFDFGFILDSRPAKDMSGAKDRIPIVELDTTSLSITHDLLYGDKKIRAQILDYIERTWKESYIPLLLDINNIITSESLNPRIIEILGKKAGVFNYYDGLQWMWSREPIYDTHYLDNKAEIYQHVDPKFRAYFLGQQETAKISLDEIVWGGVTHNGISQLKLPTMIEADEADYLDGNDIVFGIVINGEAKAYPKRILAWHEFFIDKIGNENVAGVYCALCGTMIAYDMNHRSNIHDLNTSGFLYRSNKLMVDKKTNSLWSTIEGKPILGPLTDKGIKLYSFPVVTTKWKNWKSDNPNTKVLSLDTGYERNYDEGEAYKSYFSHDGLLFPVPMSDDRLDNKDEVLLIRVPRFETDPLAISIDYLKKRRIHHNTVADKNIVVLTEKDGASRVYYSRNVKFESYKKGVLTDNRGKKWTITNEHLTSNTGRKLLRAPSHNSFWFAWYNLYPKTRLVKL